MNLERERLESVLERLEKLRHSQSGTPGEPPVASTPAMAPLSRQITSPLQYGEDELYTVLELLSLRDRFIQSELLKLQRTLSRQNFRGAESARRLVRRLARRAEQNVTDAESLQRSRTA